MIPTRNEQSTLPLLLDDLRKLPFTLQVIVADGGSTDGTRIECYRRGVTFLSCRAGRGHQLAHGAAVATAPVLCFLHADVRLDASADRAMARVLAEPRLLPAVFELGIDARGAVYRLIEFMANRVRTGLLRLPYGDQGLLVSRADYDAVGGYRDLPLMEDVEIVRALRRRGHLTVLPERVLVSARRWQQDGPWRRTFRNWTLMIAYTLGASPQRLARHYERSRPAHPDTER